MSLYLQFLIVFLLALAPGFEARYAILTAYALHLDLAISLTLCLIAIVVLSITLPILLNSVEHYIVTHADRGRVTRCLAELYMRYVERARARCRRYVDRWGFLGLVIFVAIPLPATGIWTGALAAHVLGLQRSKTITALIIGGFISLLITSAPLAIPRLWAVMSS